VPSARVAAHRFGLGEASLAVVGADPAAWLLAQIGPADAQRGDALPTLGDGLQAHADFLRVRRRRRESGSPDQAMAMDGRSTEAQFVDHFRTLVQVDLRAHLATAATTTRPFAERLAWFWANHFTVSMAKASVRALVGAFEREAIRPHVAGSFEQLLKAAVTHGAMLRYLDNELSAGPRSRVVQRLARRRRDAGDERAPRVTGLNENLAREVLELHTLGAASRAYGQADVTAFAAVLTGWRMPLRELLLPGRRTIESHFDPAWHEPGPKIVLGRRYDEGEAALGAVLHDLARHPATANFIATKLARHFVTDDPPPALVTRLQARFLDTEGDLPSVYRELVAAPQAWATSNTKLKTPAEFVVSTSRVLGLGEQPFARIPDAGVALLGQRVHAAPSPAGWPDRAEEWLGPDAIWKRVEWATRVADRVGRHLDAREIARAAFGSDGLGPSTAQQIERAADGPQAIALLLLAPEFQRR
jgi:uncharacterized protein (DUF1800 family)